MQYCRDIETLAKKKQIKRVIISNNQIEVNKKKITRKKKFCATKNDKYLNKVGESFSVFGGEGKGGGLVSWDHRSIPDS